MPANRRVSKLIHDTKLTYNDVSNIIKRETEHCTYTYGYDDLDRLAQVVPPSSISLPNTNNANNANNATADNLTLPIESYTYAAVHHRKTSPHQISG
ncbi:hypothetical protein AEM42_03820 [Betaproteobacteria bacterium UKL13-2]|jgi:hypothetical protein|nr:hypothetical protein AEM42_03820 [Betaproteobacteria bacterium UKL13-2]HCG52407.1 hypothetical protein [Betaproteobacteria bacterium]